MRPFRAALGTALFALLCAAPLGAQANAWIPLDDPHLPLLEFLIARGDIADPSPNLRPLRRNDVLRVLDAVAADSFSRAGRIARRLRQSWFPLPTDSSSWSSELRAGTQAYTSARRDDLHPAGNAALDGYGAIGTVLEAAPFAIGSRVAADNRVRRDPDWTDGAPQAAKNLDFRVLDGWISVNTDAVHVQYGQLDRNWGPAGPPGLAFANGESYAHPDLAVDARLGRFSGAWVVSARRSVPGPDSSATRRAFLAHRLAWQPTARLIIGAWEIVTVAGPPDAWSRAVVGSLYPQIGRRVVNGAPSDRNLLVGLDGAAHLGRGVQIALQAALDEPPAGAVGSLSLGDRAAVLASASGPLGGNARWQAWFSRLGPAMYSASRPDTTTLLDFTDRGVGSVRIFNDNRQGRLAVAVAAGSGLLVEPRISWLEQGAAAISHAPNQAGLPDENTIAIGLSVHGTLRGIAIDGSTDLEHVTNAEHLASRTVTRVEARLLATISIHYRRVVE
jgi:hypothetical protein